MKAAIYASALAVATLSCPPAQAMFAAWTPEALQAKATKNDVVTEGSADSLFAPGSQPPQQGQAEAGYSLDAVRR